MPRARRLLPEIGGIGFHVVWPGRRFSQIFCPQQDLHIGAGNTAEVLIGDGAGDPVAYWPPGLSR